MAEPLRWENVKTANDAVYWFLNLEEEDWEILTEWFGERTDLEVLDEFEQEWGADRFDREEVIAAIKRVRLRTSFQGLSWDDPGKT